MPGAWMSRPANCGESSALMRPSRLWSKQATRMARPVFEVRRPRGQVFGRLARARCGAVCVGVAVGAGRAVAVGAGAAAGEGGVVWEGVVRGMAGGVVAGG